MNPIQVKRKLAAILYADVAGYSRLTGEDEIGTHRNLSLALDSITAAVKSHQGTVLHFAGDAILAEFSSVVNALICAVEIQQENRERNEALPDKQRLEFRIGVNLGDVIEDRDEIYGEGVNIAARLESIAEPGGICISNAVYEQVKNKLQYKYRGIGKIELKNIAEPVVVYRVFEHSEQTGNHPQVKEPRGVRRKWRLTALAGLAMLVLFVLVVGKKSLHKESQPTATLASNTHSEIMQEKPFIAILPFRNLSRESMQDYFSDGITEDITTSLSKFDEFGVIASQSTFAYRDKSSNIVDISRALNTNYVVQGTIQAFEDKMRINVQLVDGATGEYLWGERFERKSDDLFALQDEIVTSIVAGLSIKLDETERERAMQVPPNNLRAYDYYLRGREYRLQANRAANASARAMLRRALELDPSYAAAYTELGWCSYDAILFGWSSHPSRELETAYEKAIEALGLDEKNADAHYLLGAIYLKWFRYDQAVREIERALELNPGDPDSYKALGNAQLYTGYPESAKEALKISLRLNPESSPSTLIDLGLAYYLTDEHEDAISVLEQALRKNRNLVAAHVVLAAAFARLGRTEEAQRAARDIRRLDPFFEIDSFGTAFQDENSRNKLSADLRKAGLN